MVLAYHLIFTAYGFWLPNDPRGSWSDFVRSWELFWYGAANRVTMTASLARRNHDRNMRRVQKTALRYDPVRFTPPQIQSIARGIARAVTESGYVVFACALMPDHVHMVVQRHRNLAEQMIGQFKARATQQLLADRIHPFQGRATAKGTVPCAWARRGWHVFLHSVEDILRAIDYVEDNPVRQRAPRQLHPFVTPFESRFDAIDPDQLSV